MILHVAKQSLIHRRMSVFLMFLALFVSVSLLLSIEHIRKEAKSSFYRTVSGVDLIVGGRTGQINLLLSSVFRVGANANSVSWDSYQRIISNPQVEWAIPLTLGDSHKGFAVIGTTNDYFEYYRFGDKRPLDFQAGGKFQESALQGNTSTRGPAQKSTHSHAIATHFDAVIGADTAKQLNYKVGDKITISHGLGKVSFSHHAEHPFTVVGVLEYTGTPVDQALHVGLNAIESIHAKPKSSQSFPSLSRPSLKKTAELDEHEQEHEHENEEEDFHQHEPSHNSGHAIVIEDVNEKAYETVSEAAPVEPTQISAFMLGLKSRIAVLQVQRQVNQDKLEALSAIIPGLALAELWRLVGAVENVLRVISAAVLVASLLGLSTMLLASLRERKSEIRVFRVMGAKPSFVFWLLQLEALSIAFVACLASLLSVMGFILIGSDYLLSEYGLSISANILSLDTLWVICVVLLATFVITLLPSIGAYRNARSLN
ncbi:ABC transporter permease [Glaciecola sp. MF2-115]|uniref:ABC transporter permease n=1 Tax=Glaciecola sp. MF2-115 TaxID=3384827 RepID=UPI0039A1CFBA